LWCEGGELGFVTQMIWKCQISNAMFVVYDFSLEKESL
jgi:hypothetical protein